MLVSKSKLINATLYDCVVGTLEVVQGALCKGFNPREVGGRQFYCHLGHMPIAELKGGVPH